MEKRNWFIFYYSFWEAISELPDENQLELYKAISNYSFNFEEPNFSWINKTVWILIKPQLEANNRRYENSKKWGAPKGNKNAGKDWWNTSKQPKDNQDATKWQPKEKEKGNVKEKEKAKVKDNVFYIEFKKWLWLTHKAYSALLDEYPKKEVDTLILELENYIVNNPKWRWVKDCNLTIRTWLRRNWVKKKQKQEDKKVPLMTDNFFTSITKEIWQ